MKKVLPWLLLISSSALANTVTINCPTADNYVTDGKQWKIRVEKDKDNIRQYYDFDPVNKILEGYMPAPSSITAKFTYDSYSARAIQNGDEITLQCIGSYFASECFSWGWGQWKWNEGCWAVPPTKLIAAVTLDSYKSCMSTSDGTAFNCTK